MKPASLKRVKAARVKEGDKIVMADDEAYFASDVRRVVQAAKKLENGEKQTPGHLMTITVIGDIKTKRFRVLPSADLFIVAAEVAKKSSRPASRTAKSRDKKRIAPVRLSVPPF